MVWIFTCLVIVSISSNNQLSELPDDLNLPNLKVIVLNDNKFISYPSALKQHNKIEEIYLYGNQITELPAHTFKNQLNLNGLYLSRNPLGHVPSCLERSSRILMN